MSDKEFYFAFGSNISPRRIHERGAKVISREGAVLPGYRLTFDVNRLDDGFGFSTIVPADSDSVVYGALYTCEEGSLEKLDRDHIPEGHFRHKKVEVQTKTGKRVEAIAYIANEALIQSGLKPSKDYLAEILEGDDLLPKEYVEFLKSFISERY